MSDKCFVRENVPDRRCSMLRKKEKRKKRKEKETSDTASTLAQKELNKGMDAEDELCFFKYT